MPTAATLDRSQLPHGQLFWPDLSRLLPGDYRFNPTLAQWRGTLWMIYRRIPVQTGKTVLEWSRLLSLAKIGDDLEPDRHCGGDLASRIVDPPGTRRWHADARFFVLDGRPWFSYHNNKSLYVIPLDLDDLTGALTPARVQLANRQRRPQERNWGFFDHGGLHAVYAIDPHIILRFEAGDGGDLMGRVVAETQAQIPWRVDEWGAPHGGSSPVLVGDCWFSFFHSNRALNADGTGRVYRVGFYGFDARPPYRIRYMSPEPLLSADRIDGDRSFYGDYSVVYPSGAVYDRGQWLVSLGIHDRRLAFTQFEHQRLLAEAVAFPAS